MLARPLAHSGTRRPRVLTRRLVIILGAALGFVGIFGALRGYETAGQWSRLGFVVAGFIAGAGLMAFGGPGSVAGPMRAVTWYSRWPVGGRTVETAIEDLRADARASDFIWGVPPTMVLAGAVLAGLAWILRLLG